MSDANHTESQISPEECFALFNATGELLSRHDALTNDERRVARDETKRMLGEIQRDIEAVNRLKRAVEEAVARELSASAPRTSGGGSSPEEIADEIDAPRAPTDVPVTPEPTPVLPAPAPAPGATSTPPPASSAAVKDAIAEGDDEGETETAGITAVKAATEEGIVADTPAKWQSKAAQQAIKTYVNRATAHMHWILQHNQFLKRDKEAADRFTQAARQQFAIIDEYLKGVAAKDVVAFKQVVVAIANLQKLFEQAVEDTIVDVEASIAAIAHLKGIDSTEYKMLDNLRSALKKRREVYDTFVQQLRAACPETLDDVNLEIPPRPEKSAGELVYRGSPMVLKFIVSDATRRLTSWQFHWRDETIRHQQPAFQMTFLINWVAQAFLSNRSAIPQDLLFDALKTRILEFKPTAEQINDAIREVLSCESGEEISNILPPVLMPPEDIAGEGKNLTDIVQGETQLITPEMARTILNNYTKLLERSLLTRYAYPAVSLQEKRAKVKEAYGPALKELEDTINNWNDGASIRAAGAIDALNTTLRADLERVDKAIKIALERKVKTGKRKTLLSAQKWRNLFLADLTQWKRVVEQAHKDLPAHVGEKKS